MLSSHACALLSALLDDLPGTKHLLTLHTRHVLVTSVERREDGFEAEHPAVVERLCAAVTSGGLAAVVLRSPTDRISHTLADGVGVPVTLVRGWTVTDRTLVPLDEARMFDAYCTDSASGEPIPPEPGVVYTDAPAVDLTLFHGT